MSDRNRENQGGRSNGQAYGQDYYRWSGGDDGQANGGQAAGGDMYRYDGGDYGQPSRPQRNDGGANARFRDEAYHPPARHHQARRTDYYPPQGGGYPPRGGCYPQEVRTPGRNGGDNVMIVYGNVYITDGANDNGCGCRRRDDGRDEYYGRGYDYSQYYRWQNQQYQQYYNYAYRQPQCEPCQPYYEYGFRQYQPQPNYYNRGGGACFNYEGGGGWQGQARFRVRVGF